MPGILDLKIFNREALYKTCMEWHANNFKIIFTNGCFDILHEGHVRYLAEAKSLGNKLIVGINSDESVRKLKGADRPIHSEKSRAIVLAGLESVDAVIIFNEDTPLELITKIRPDVLVKGGDWSVEQIVGSDVVLKNGGSVLSLSFYKGHSTTLTEQKIKRQIG